MKQDFLFLLELKIILCFPRKKAEVFNELYQILLATSARANRNNIRKQMLEMLEGFDENLNYISKIAEEEESLESEQLSGITYRDFRVLCLERGFKEAFENLIFSTKIIFTARDDFYQFLQDLIANGFEHIALFISKICHRSLIMIKSQKLSRVFAR